MQQLAVQKLNAKNFQLYKISINKLYVINRFLLIVDIVSDTHYRSYSEKIKYLLL